MKLSEFSSPKQYSRSSVPLPFPKTPFFGQNKTPQTVTLQVKIERGQKAIKNQHTVPDHVLAYPLRRKFPAQKNTQNFHLQCYHFLVDVPDIFNFFLLGEGGGGVRGVGRRGGSILIENHRRGGEGFQEGEGPRGREGVCAELGFFLGRGDLNIFFRGRNVHQDLQCFIFARLLLKAKSPPIKAEMKSTLKALNSLTSGSRPSWPYLFQANGRGRCTRAMQFFSSSRWENMARSA